MNKMAASYPPHQLSHILTHIIAVNPKRILDVGCGWGKWGFLLKEYLDGGFAGGLKIDGVEPWQKYLVQSGAGRFYDSLYKGDFVKTMIHQPLKYDLVLMIDVLDRMEMKDGGQALLKALRLGDQLLITVPGDVDVPAITDDNPFEQHRSDWTAENFTVHLRNAWKEDELVVTDHSRDSSCRIFYVRKKHVANDDVARAAAEEGVS